IVPLDIRGETFDLVELSHDLSKYADVFLEDRSKLELGFRPGPGEEELLLPGGLPLTEDFPEFVLTDLLVHFTIGRLHAGEETCRIRTLHEEAFGIVVIDVLQDLAVDA